MIVRNGAGPDGAVGTIETGGIVDFGNINAPSTAENSPHPQAADIAVRPVDPVVVVCTPAGYGKRGPLFSASFDGRTIVTASVTPFLDAARVLAAEGHDPATVLVLRHASSATDALRSTIGAAAKLTVVQEGDGAPRFRPWKAFSRPAVAPPMRRTEEAAITPHPPAPDGLAAPEASHRRGAL